MSRTFAFGMITVGLFLLATPSSVLAQCTWCTSTVDACCDGHSSLDYTLPCATTNIYFQYNGSADNRVEVVLYDITGGGEILLQGATNGACDCNNSHLYTAATPMPSGTALRFKVRCHDCNGDCDEGNVTVKFFTPSSNACAANCVGS